MAKKPYELLVRLKKNGEVGGISARYIDTIGGKEIETDPESIASTTDPAFTEFATLFAAAAVEDRDAKKAEWDEQKTQYKTEIAELQSTQQSLQANIDTKNAKIDDLQSKLEEKNERIQTLLDKQTKMDELLAKLPELPELQRMARAKERQQAEAEKARLEARLDELGQD